MLHEYPEVRISRLAAGDRRGSPRSLCMLLPRLMHLASTDPAWTLDGVALAGLGEPVDAPTFPRSEPASRVPCLSGQTECLVPWLQACRLVHRRIHLHLDVLSLADDPRLEPDLDIPLDEQQSLLREWSQADALTHFERLGLAPTADQKKIRRAYHATCRRLHPDRWYGRRIGAFAGVLVDLFHRAHAAQAYLSDRRRCALYMRDLAAAGHDVDALAIPLVVLRAPSRSLQTAARPASR